MRSALIIPTLDEKPALTRILPGALASADEVWVSDGGSTDGTAEWARSQGATVLTGPPGRGRQLDAAARATRADLLVFLHADTVLPPEALASARQSVVDGAVGGGFQVRFDEDRPWLRLGARLINLRTRLTRCPLGDQAQFVRRDVYEAVGGFPPWPVLEDLHLARRIQRQGPVAILDPPVVTAARRFLRQGPARTVATNWAIWTLYFLGVSPIRLGRLYAKIR